jgi:hypothetical protein
VNVAGLKLAGVGIVIEIVAGIWNELVHHFFSREPTIAPAHALLTVGMLTVAFGMIIGLTIEHGMIKHGIIAVSGFKRWLTLICLVLTFASIWLTAAGAFIYLARVFRTSPLNWMIAVLLAMVGPLVLVPAKRVLPKNGTAITIGIIFNAVSYMFLVAYAGTPAYIPWGLLPLALFDLLALVLKRVMKVTPALLISSTVIGLLFWATYYPYTLYLFPWSSSPQLPAVSVFIGGFAGAILGNAVYAGLSSVVLGDVAT